MGIGGGGEGAAEVIEEGGAEEEVDVQAGAAGGENGDGGGVGVGFKEAGGAEIGELLKGWGELEAAGVETVGEGVLRADALALRGAGAGGFEGIGAVGGEALFGDGDFGHGQRSFRWRRIFW